MKGFSVTIPIRCTYTKLEDPRKLKPNPRNPNKHPERQLDIYEEVVRLQGWRRAAVVSKRSGLIVMGHGAREVAIRLKCKLPVDYQDFASEEEEHAQMLADHRIPELSDFDSQSALSLLGDLDTSQLSMAGYSMDSLQELEVMAEAEAEKEAESPTEIKPVKVQPPPKFGWALIGIPIVEFGKVQALLARLPAAAVIKTTANDGPKEKET